MVVSSKRASIAGVAFNAGLHTDQQSLILGEMMTARNKLQQENQTLRDRLQDLEMMVRLLQYKLTEHNAGFDITKEFGIMIDDLPALKNTTGSKINRKPMEKTKTNLMNKNAFRNQVAPGKKTFESKAIKRSSATGSLAKHNMALPQSPNSRSLMLHSMSCSPDSRFVEPEDARPTVVSGGLTIPQRHSRNRLKMNLVSSINKKNGSTKSGSSNGDTGRNSTGGVGHHVHCFGEEQFPGDAQQMRSVIGKLAQVVINEYSTTDDDEENIIFEG